MVNKYFVFFIISIAAFMALVNVADATCTDNKVTAYTNIYGAPITIKSPNLDGKKTLTVGETWDLGSGYTLTASSIDTISKQTWLSLSKDGSKLDDSVRSEGQWFNYSNIFSAKIDSFFQGKELSAVQLRYVNFFSQPYFWHTRSGIASTQSGNQWYWKSDNIYSQSPWTISYEKMDGYQTPANETKTQPGMSCIEFTGIYRGVDITVTSNLDSAAFTVNGPGGYSKSGTGKNWIDTNVKGGSYSVTFQAVSEYITPSLKTQYIAPGNAFTFIGDYAVIPGTGSISITSSPSGAEVYLDGVPKGNSPQMLTGIPIGAHVIWCKKTDFEDFMQSVSVTSTEIATLTCSMVLSGAVTPEISPTPTDLPPNATVGSTVFPGIGSISVVSNPDGAEVYIDGVKKGNAFKTIPDVSVGQHMVWCQKEGYEVFQQVVTVTSGDTASVTCNLELSSGETPSETETPEETETVTPNQTQQTSAPGIIFALVSILMIGYIFRKKH